MERKLTKYLILISLILFTSQIFSQSQIKLLERAYKENSDSLMQIFFNQWEKDLPVYPLNLYEHADDTLKAIVEIYKLFYLPQDYPKIKKGISELVYNKFNDSNYIIILNPKFLPSNITYGITEKILYFDWYNDPYWTSYKNQFEGNNRMDTVKPPEPVRSFGIDKFDHINSYISFRPAIESRNVLFLDSTYYGIIHSFFTGHFNKTYLKRLNTQRGEQFLEEVSMKLKFLSKYIPVFISGCQNEFLEIYDEDSINKIVFNSNLTQAVVSIRNNNTNHINYYLQKTDDDWIIKGWSYMIVCCG